jgi:hypothetical protein
MAARRLCGACIVMGSQAAPVFVTYKQSVKGLGLQALLFRCNGRFDWLIAGCSILGGRRVSQALYAHVCSSHAGLLSCT